MKKQRKMVDASSSNTSKKKKVTKRELEKQSLAAAAVAEKDIIHGGERAAEGNSQAAAMVVDNESSNNDGCLSMAGCNEDHWRTWLRPQVLVDEQMSWGSVWFSFWEQEDDCCHATFYSDVFEEDDIWDLRSIKQVPQ